MFIVASALVWHAEAAMAQAPSAVGWWWKGNVGSASFPVVVDPVPDPGDGLFVSSDATGPSGVSALRFEVPDGAPAAQLVLRVVESVGTPDISACRSSRPWSAAAGGPWPERPTEDCGAGVARGALAADGTSVTFDLGSVPVGGVLDVVIVPYVEPGAPVAPTFSTSFEAPGEDTLIVEPLTSTSVDSRTPVNQFPNEDSGVGERPPNSSTSVSLPPIDRPIALPEAMAPNPVPAAPPVVANLPPATADVADTVRAGFVYPAIFLLPLVLLAVGGYFGAAFTRPCVLAEPSRP